MIDFQDARIGPYLYDLVSLVEDPYVELNGDQKESIKKDFFDLSTVNYEGDIEELYRTTAIQRIFKACGSFASQYNLKNKRDYLQYLAPALSNLIELLDDTDFPILKDFVGLNNELWKLSGSK